MVTSGVRPRGDVIYFAVADEEHGSAHGARWVADHHPDAIRCDYLLTESGGLHDGSPEAPAIGVTVGEKGVAWRRLRVHGTPGHGSMPFRIDNALVKAAAVVQRLAEYRPAPRFHELWPARVELAGHPRRAEAPAARPGARSTPPSTRCPSAAAAAHLHACTHTTFSPNLIDGGVMKTNVIPDSITLDVDVRTLPGRRDRRGRLPTCGRRSATSPTTSRSRSSSTTRRRSAAPTRRCGTRCSGPSRCRSRAPRCRRSSPSASPTPACSASSARSPTAPGCSARTSTPPSSAAASTATTSASTSRASASRSQLWQRVLADLAS